MTAAPALARLAPTGDEIELDHREASVRYRGEVHRVGHWRVVVCKDGIQAVVQRQRGGATGAAGARWEAVGSFATRAALLRLWRQVSGDDGAALLALPEVIRRRR